MMSGLKQKLKDKKGFTLAELLVVVAIIAVLVAVAIPTFSAALNKANHGVLEANARSAFAEYMYDYISGEGAKDTYTYTTGSVTTICTVKLNGDKTLATVVATLNNGSASAPSETFTFGITSSPVPSPTSPAGG